MYGFAQDLRQAAGQLRKTPAFAVTVVLMLGLGIGATTTIFSFIYGILLKPLPYPQPDRIVLLFETSERARKVFAVNQIPVSLAMALEWRHRARSFESMGIFRGTQAYLGSLAQPERIRGAWITGGALQAMGVQPIRGALFGEAEEKAGRDDIVVIGEALWHSHFGGRPDTIGQTIRLDDKPLTIIGVMPESFTFPRGYEIAGDQRPVEPSNFWRPLQVTAGDRANYGNHNVSGVARLKPGISPAQAQSELARIASAIYTDAAPAAAREFGVSVVRYHQNLVGNSRDALLLLGGCVLLVLLIACANIAGLLMVRAVVRQREIALRASLGASPARLTCHALAESLLLALPGGLAGTLLSVWGIQLMRSLAGSRLPRLDAVGLDGMALAFALAVSLLTALVFGLAPAIFATRVNLVESLKESSRTSVGAGHHRFRAALVVAQIALSMTLLCAAGLLGRSLYSVLQADRGFQVSGVMTMRIPLPKYSYRTDEARQAFFDRLLQGVGALPGVESAGIVNQLPLTGEGDLHSISIEGQQPKPGEEPIADIRIVTAGYFPSLKVPLRKGRRLADSDRTGAPAVAVINETMARRFWPHQNPIGKRFRLGERESLPWVTAVGVAADSRQSSLEKEITPQVFRPFAQDPATDMFLTVRTDAAPERSVPAVRAVIRDIDPQQPVLQIRTLEDILDESVSGRRLQMWILGVFAIYALILAAAGVHSTVAYSATQRTREFGIRAALGARKSQLLGMVLRQGIHFAVAGLALGAAGALVLGRFLSGFLYGVKPGDVLTIASVALLLLATTVVATLLPAWRSSRVEPSLALREN